MRATGFLLAVFLMLMSGAPSLFPAAFAAESPVSITIFTSPTCPHCHALQQFLSDIEATHPGIIALTDYPIADHLDRAEAFYEQYDVPRSQRGLVPAIFFPDQFVVGFGSATEDLILSYVVGQTTHPASQIEINPQSTKIDVPLLGAVNPYDYSLPLLALVLGLADGFNVCSLGALIMILGMVIAFRSRLRMLTLGGIFILTTAIIYGALIFLWHRLFTILSGLITFMELFMGLLSLAAGFYLLYLFWKSYRAGPVCSSNNIMTRLTPRIQQLFSSKKNIFSLLVGIMLFAAVVTIVEFPCSAVLPVIFAGIIAESSASSSLTFFSILIYMIAYLVDEILIFVVAVWTLKIHIVSPRWIVFMNLLSAGIFIGLGVWYILRTI